MLISIFILVSLRAGCAAFRSSLPPSRSARKAIGTAPRLAAVLRRDDRAPSRHLLPSPPQMSSTSDGGGGDGEADRLRETASKLRAEAQAAERALNRRPASASTSSAEGTAYAKPAEYSDLRGSCWEVTYRFANEPESDDDSNGEKENAPQRKFYSGKIPIRLRSDGYTDVLASDTDGSGGSTATFGKVWGWDLETSSEDSLEYLLFSADITLPPPISISERFYFQARVDKEANKNVLYLNEGSVTVKRDIEAPTGGWWGIFRGADGILARFRQVGEFRCRPIANPNP